MLFDDLKTAIGQFSLAAQRVAMTAAAIDRQAACDHEKARSAPLYNRQCACDAARASKRE
jgi:hypothetical protein